ncbi:MAG: hypothetical protein K5776_08520 [Lachnospiraceae bacterium]|nr:hypothetical protein [Lachnospiraceae bacterium]
MKSKGIFKTYKKDNTPYYRVFVTRKGKHISLGSYEKESDACECYNDALNILEDKNISYDDYRDSYKISFDKFIVLVNFRDSGIYISNPIYLRPNFFYYFLDKDTILKFDKDDLFYYSKHKICKRGNHLFCYEYGNQISINERYNIGSYAVVDKDYRFINGDKTDYRYSNIEILNSFHGVRKITEGAKTFYEAKIHVNGYIKIGEFNSEIEAAIAYNKAVDLLKKKYDKNFVQNFPDLNAKEYASIYSETEISPRIYEMIN